MDYVPVWVKRKGVSSTHGKATHYYHIVEIPNIGCVAQFSICDVLRVWRGWSRNSVIQMCKRVVLDHNSRCYGLCGYCHTLGAHDFMILPHFPHR